MYSLQRLILAKAYIRVAKAFYSCRNFVCVGWKTYIEGILMTYESDIDPAFREAVQHREQNDVLEAVAEIAYGPEYAYPDEFVQLYVYRSKLGDLVDDLRYDIKGDNIQEGRMSHDDVVRLTLRPENFRDIKIVPRENGVSDIRLRYQSSKADTLYGVAVIDMNEVLKATYKYYDGDNVLHEGVRDLYTTRQTDLAQCYTESYGSDVPFTVSFGRACYGGRIPLSIVYGDRELVEEYDDFGAEHHSL